MIMDAAYQTPRMNEDFLHYIWQHGLFDKQGLRTHDGLSVEILSPGLYNLDQGPDFIDARLRIDGRLWAGNVEIHRKSSDWFAHHHEQDPRYDSVILHVVYEYDMPVYNTHDVYIPVLELQGRIPGQLLNNWNFLRTNKHPLACAGRLASIDKIVQTQWLERLYVERLERRTESFRQMLKRSVQDWEGVLYAVLLRYFGMPGNSDVFEQLASALPYDIFKKYTGNLLQLEALLLGTAGLLDEAPADDYTKQLQTEFDFLRQKHRLRPLAVKPRFGRMRPANFPSIRLAQFAMLYHRHPQLFDLLIHKTDPALWAGTLRTGTSDYWKTHYRPGKTSKQRSKITGRSFVEKLIVNVLIPVQFAWQTAYGTPDTEPLLELARRLPSENNRITRLFAGQGLPNTNALHSQALMQLKTAYCDAKRCTLCAFGNQILRSGENT